MTAIGFVRSLHLNYERSVAYHPCLHHYITFLPLAAWVTHVTGARSASRYCTSQGAYESVGVVYRFTSSFVGCL